MDSKKWITDLLKEKGISIPEGMEDQFITPVEERLAEFITLELAQSLNDEDKALLQSMLEITPESLDIEAFFRPKVEDFDLEVKRILEKFKQTFSPK